MITKTETRLQKTKERISKKPINKHLSWRNKRTTTLDKN
jgi:hypothetical protein